MTLEVPTQEALRPIGFHAHTGREAVHDVCKNLLAHGQLVAPRGQQTLELAPVLVELENPTDTLPDAINRARLLPAIAAAEALQNVAGVAMPGLMHRISKFFPKPSSRWDEGNANYGERLGSQLGDVVEILRRDPESREAVASIWREGDMTNGQALNLCTVSLQFLRRSGRLDMIVNMRSNDAWYGLCYDLFQFAQVQLTIARCLGVPAGRYFHWASSMHLYERHWEAAAGLVAPIVGFSAPQPLRGIGVLEGQSWDAAQGRALALLHGRTIGGSPTEKWYAEQLAPYGPDGT